jgi:hypothetical protein
MDFENLLNFERASTATYYDSEGVLQIAEVNEPRLDHDPVTLEPLGLLVEEERTNLITNSENLSTGWTNTRVTVVPLQENGRVANGLSKITEDTTLGTHDVTRDLTQTIPSSMCFSFVFKPSALKNRKLRVYYVGVSNGGSSSGFIVGEDGSISGVISLFEKVTSEQIAEDTFLIKVTTKLIYGDDISGVLYFRLAELDGNSTYTGDGTSHIFLGEVQAELGSFPTSYIPTTGSAATRSPDICSAKSVHPWLDENEGTVYIELDKKAGSYVGNYLTLSDGTSDNQIAIKDRSVFYKETNYMPSPFDPSGWSGAGDPNISYNSAIEGNPSGVQFVGEFEYLGVGFAGINASFNNPATNGDTFYCCMIIKSDTSDMGLRVYFNSEGNRLNDTYVNANNGSNSQAEDIKINQLADGYFLVQISVYIPDDSTDVDCFVQVRKVDSAGINQGQPDAGDKIKCQAAFFGTADDWPAIINDTNIIKSGANNLTGTQGFTSALESGQSKLALSYDSSTYSAAKDGVGFSGTNAGVPALTDLYVGSNGTNRFFNGHIKDVQYYPRKLTESELIELTT